MTSSDQATAAQRGTPEAPPNWREYQALELPKILEVTLAHIVEHGYDATSVRTLAREVGVTVPALYYHYENKQGMLMALLEHAMTLVTTRIDAALAEAGEDPVSRLSALVEAIVLCSAHHPDLAFLDSERRSLTPENLSRYLEYRDRIDRRLEAAIEDGSAAGVFATPVPREARRAILSMAQGIASWFRPGGPKSPAETASDYVRISLAALEYVGPT
ncbi:TetR/AcrR family transcriptional regulator [Nocardia asteroides]|uniref:TetR/AcrR family transcriptional regulator n=1 Tax=Nocardia asteroides TaxID=1824 RepID=UPI001E39DA32|nr:TetR/AcrR family transcriptional regulator [Nocardia asteroides]UGT55089.1 TetR/AcrR family transcriptional regulator [Nocardia asteroides]